MDYATSNGSATDTDGDFLQIPATTLTFSPGEISKTVTVAVNGDLKFESDETFHVDLSNADHATILDTRGEGTIRNDDVLPSISINDVSEPEGNAGTISFDFTLSLGTASSQAVTVDFSSLDGTARISDGDYVASAGTVTFDPGVTARQVSITVNGDILNEADETFFLRLFNGVNATISDSTGLGTIMNDDPLPCLSINDIADDECNGGMKAVNFIAKLSPASGQTVQVDFSTADGTALAGSDYIPNNGILIFNPGDTTKLISVLTVGDYAREPDETFYVDLTSPVHSTICRDRGVDTILNDDSIPGVGINDIRIAEGDTGTTKATFTLTLSIPDVHPDTVHFSTADSSATAAGEDYVASSGMVTFAPGESTKTVTILVRGDRIDEPDESFLVNLTNSNMYITNVQGVCTILNDDGIRTLTIDDVAIEEGNAGTRNAIFTVHLSAVSPESVTAQYGTSDGSATVSGSDYIPANGTLTLDPGQTSGTIAIVVNGDNLKEANEQFTLNLSNSTHAIIADSQGICTILDDDSMPAISVDDVSVKEGNTGSTTATFDVILSSPAAQAVSVHWSTVSGTATDVDGDFVPASGTLLFNPQETVKSIPVTVNGDYVQESDEQFFLKLSAPFNAILGDSVGTATILNDDGKICIRKYFDKNHNQRLDDGEEAMPGVLFTLTGTDHTVNGRTDANGEVCFTGLPVEEYQLTEEVPTGYTYSYPPNGSLAVQYLAGLDMTITWLNTSSVTSNEFRTARSEDWATALNSSHKLKAEKRKPDKVQAKLVISAPAAASGFTLKFNMPFTGMVYDGTSKTTLLTTVTHAKAQSVSVAVSDGQVFQIEGYGEKGKFLGVTVVWQTLPRTTTQTYKDPARFMINQPRLPMPNLHNVGEELFPNRTGQTGVAFPAGLLVAAPRGQKLANSVIHKAYRNVLSSLNNKGRLHVGAPRCLDFFDGNGIAIARQQRSLPPTRQDNKLFAEILALKLNVAASMTGKFPVGLGELTYLNQNDPENLLNNHTVNQIITIADTILSCARVTSMRPDPTFAELYNVVRGINEAFAGPVDSMSFGTKTVLTGMRTLGEVAYMIATPGLIPAEIHGDAVTEQPLPLDYRLDQNYPNPFNPTTTIQFELPVPALVTLKVYNTLGQEVATLVDHEQMDEGDQEVEFAAQALASGVYFYSIRANPLEEADGPTFAANKKMILLK